MTISEVRLLFLDILKKGSSLLLAFDEISRNEKGSPRSFKTAV
jgi:hypothetical protein